jgi:hypothetical protein
MTDRAVDFSLVRGDWPSRLQQAIGLMPAGGGLGVGRRVLVLVSVTWVPIAIWAVLTGRMLAGRVQEPLFQHFGVHTRCLVAIPLLVVAGATLHAVSRRLVSYFLSSGLVPVPERPQFDAAVAGVARLRDQALPWLLIAAVVIGVLVARPIGGGMHELEWAADDLAGHGRRFGFGGWWFAYVVRPVFLSLLLAFLWRIVLLGELLRRIAALRLSIVPSHPDRTGGLGFLEHVPLALGPGILAISAVVASRWGHDVAFHGATLPSLKWSAAGLVIGLAVLALAPLATFAGTLRPARTHAVFDYGALVGEHGRRVHRKWVAGEPVEDREGLLSAPELGPVADTAALYEAVRRMRTIPIGPQALAAVLVPAVLPLVAVAAIRIPLKDILQTLLQALL